VLSSFRQSLGVLSSLKSALKHVVKIDDALTRREEVSHEALIITAATNSIQIFKLSHYLDYDRLDFLIRHRLLFKVMFCPAQVM
jgi:hypothetical protein